MTAVVAAVQATPVFLDRDATVEKTCALVKEAAGHGASLVVFPETFVPTYPDWVWRAAAWRDGRYVSRLYDQSVAVPSAATERLGAAAAESGVYAAVGVNEVEGGTLYNTLLYFAPDGSLAGRHRKLMPTGGERTVWGMGDGSTLGVVDTPFGVVGGLICWENYMPLARAAMYAQGVDIYLAPTWDNSDVWLATLRHIAKEGRVYVVGVAPVLRGSDVPSDLRGDLYGEVLAGPVVEREEILYAEVDATRARASRQQFDPVGHYSRPDVFRLTVDRSARRPVTFDPPSLP
jgi:nitrilase